MMFLPTSAGIAFAGENEVGIRIAHAFGRLLAMGLLWALCRRVMPNAARLHCLMVTYAIGSVGVLSIAITHLIFRGNEASKADAVKGAVFAIPIFVACAGYLSWIGVIGRDRWGISHYSVHPPFHRADPLLRMGTLLSGIIRADWISWWIAP